jgi:putative ABC transport system substrate-binding protein
MLRIRRRDFITLLGGAAAWPVAARAQQTVMPMVGYLAGRSQEADLHLVTAFRQSLAGLGFIEGQNVRIEYRFADGSKEKLATMAADLVGQRVAVIAASTAQAAQAAKNATGTIPIVFSIGADPVTGGFVTSLSRPSGNLTGVTTFAAELGTKQFGLVDEIVPAPAVIGYLHDRTTNDPHMAAVQSAARLLNRKLIVQDASSAMDIDAAFLSFGQQRIGALLVANGIVFGTQLHEIVVLANHYKIPTVHPRREFAVAGGLMSYGTSFIDAYRQLGVYVGRVLKGAKPTDLPVLLPTKFELIINLKTARAAGFDVPPGLSARADEIIE